MRQAVHSATMLKFDTSCLGDVDELNGFRWSAFLRRQQALDLRILSNGHHVFALLAVLSPCGADSAFFTQTRERFHYLLPLGLIAFPDESCGQVVVGSHVVRRECHHLAQKGFRLVVVLLFKMNLTELI